MRDQPVRLGVIEGRVDKATTDRQEQIQWYSNELSRVSDMAQGAYTQIQMIMQFTQMDYETAKDTYQTEFNNRMSVYKTISDEYNADRAFASTQWSMMASYISKGQMTWDSMSKDQKAQVTKYEAQMGLPIGFMSKLQMEAGANVISTTQRVSPNGGTYTDIVYKDTTGATKVKSVYTGQTRIASSGGSTASDKQMQTDIKDMNSALWAKKGSDNNVSPNTYVNYKKQWMDAGYSSYSFDKTFGHYINETYAYENRNEYQLDATYLKEVGKSGTSTSTNPF
jgi:hypothetical protein